jgi:hypothetical protein
MSTNCQSTLDEKMHKRGMLQQFAAQVLVWPQLVATMDPINELPSFQCAGRFYPSDQSRPDDYSRIGAQLTLRANTSAR